MSTHLSSCILLFLGSNQKLIIVLIIFYKNFIQNSIIAVYYIGSAEGHEYPYLLVGDEVNPRTLFELT
jgi:cadmium resistance protein CadD (predicted permease)